jgi:sugar phosphate isomerase/epimerase
MGPALVGKEPGTDHPPIPLDRMLDMTRAAAAGGRSFDGVDLSLYLPHIDLDADGEMERVAEALSGRGLLAGSLVAPVWADLGGGSAMGDESSRRRFLAAVEKSCRAAKQLRALGVRQYGAVRIDSADSPANWATDPPANTRRIAETFREAGRIAADHGERLAAEGEICWAGMHSWRHMIELLELVDRPGLVGFQADLAHTYLYMLGYNAPEHRLINNNPTDEEFWSAYKRMTDALRPWTLDVHIAQSDGTVFGSGAHDKTGRHCRADDPRGKLDISQCAGYWLRNADGTPRTDLEHICWDGCMIANEVLESPAAWNNILQVMVDSLPEGQ